MIKLGRSCQITIGTNNVRESYEFYQLLGFRKLAEDNHPYPWVKMTDDSLVILLYENGDSYMGLAYFDKDMDKVVTSLAAKGVQFVQRNSQESIFISPTDTVVVLVKANHEAMLMPKNSMLLDLLDSDYALTERYPNKALGIFGEFSHPVLDIEEAISFWQGMGFRLHHQVVSPYPWALMYDGNMILGFHETNDFDNLAISYFAPDVKEKVKQLEEKGVYSITEYRGHGGDENNVVIRTPENQQIFLFQSQAV